MVRLIRLVCGMLHSTVTYVNVCQCRTCTSMSSSHDVEMCEVNVFAVSTCQLIIHHVEKEPPIVWRFIVWNSIGSMCNMNRRHAVETNQDMNYFL